MGVQLATTCAWLKPKTKICCISSNSLVIPDRAKMTYDLSCKLANALGFTRNYERDGAAVSRNGNMTTVEMRNGSVVYHASSSVETLNGRKFDLIIVDDGFFFDAEIENVDEHPIMHLARTSGCRVVVLNTGSVYYRENDANTKLVKNRSFNPVIGNPKFVSFSSDSWQFLQLGNEWATEEEREEVAKLQEHLSYDVWREEHAPTLTMLPEDSFKSDEQLAEEFLNFLNTSDEKEV